LPIAIIAKINDCDSVSLKDFKLAIGNHKSSMSSGWLANPGCSLSQGSNVDNVHRESNRVFRAMLQRVLLATFSIRSFHLS
jgi:hypothetical protein